MPQEPKLLHEHLADKTFRKDRHGDLKAQLAVDPLIKEIPPVPAHCRNPTNTFNAWWKYYCGLMIDSGILVERDLPAVVMICDAHDQMAKAEVLLNREGRYQTSDKGVVSAHPAIIRREGARKEIFNYQKELGLTVRARASTGPAVQDKSIPASNGVTGRRRK